MYVWAALRAAVPVPSVSYADPASPASPAAGGAPCGVAPSVCPSAGPVARRSPRSSTPPRILSRTGWPYLPGKAWISAFTTAAAGSRSCARPPNCTRSAISWALVFYRQPIRSSSSDGYGSLMPEDGLGSRTGQHQHVRFPLSLSSESWPPPGTDIRPQAQAIGDRQEETHRGRFGHCDHLPGTSVRSSRISP